MKNWKLIVMASLLIWAGGLVACDAPDEEAEADPAEEEEADDEAAEDEEAAEEEEDEDEGSAALEAGEATIGEAAPDFTLVDEEGESHTLSDYQGKTVVLEWFNMECPYVVRHYEEQTTGNMIEEFGGEDVVWLAVDSTHNHTAETTQEWKEETADIRPHDFPVLQDADGEVGRLYDAKTTPHMFVIDEEGVLQYMGGMDDDPRGDEEAEDRTNYVAEALTALQEGEEVDPSEAEAYGCTIKYDEES